MNKVMLIITQALGKVSTLGLVIIGLNYLIQLASENIFWTLLIIALFVVIISAEIANVIKKEIEENE